MRVPGIASTVAQGERTLRGGSLKAAKYMCMATQPDG